MGFNKNNIGTIQSVGGISLFDSIQSTQNATQIAAGLMSSADKKKLDGIEDGANKYIHPNTTAEIGTYMQPTIDEYGHVVGGRLLQDSTLADYQITDAHISEDGVITLGENTITPLTAESDLSTDKLVGVITPEHLPIATSEAIGAVKVGDNIDIKEDGTIYFDVDTEGKNIATEEDILALFGEKLPEYPTGVDTISEWENWTAPLGVTQVKVLYGNRTNSIGDVSTDGGYDICTCTEGKTYTCTRKVDDTGLVYMRYIGGYKCDEQIGKEDSTYIAFKHAEYTIEYSREISKLTATKTLDVADSGDTGEKCSCEPASKDDVNSLFENPLVDKTEEGN